MTDSDVATLDPEPGPLQEESHADSAERALIEEARRHRRRRWRRGTAAALLLAAGGIALGLVLSGGNSATSTTSGTRGSFPTSHHTFGATSTRGWAEHTFTDDGLAVQIRYPSSWTKQLGSCGFDYADDWAAVANFPLNRTWCRVRGPVYWSQIGTFPATGGVLMTLGTSGYGPIPRGLPTTGRALIIDGRRARLSVEQTGPYLGTGSTGARLYSIADGHTQGHFDLSFTYSGSPSPRMVAELAAVADSVRIRPDPDAPYRMN